MNLLVRVVLRDLDKRSRTRSQNALRDRTHHALHQGTQRQWDR